MCQLCHDFVKFHLQFPNLLTNIPASDKGTCCHTSIHFIPTQTSTRETQKSCSSTHPVVPKFVHEASHPLWHGNIAEPGPADFAPTMARYMDPLNQALSVNTSSWTRTPVQEGERRWEIRNHHRHLTQIQPSIAGKIIKFMTFPRLFQETDTEHFKSKLLKNLIEDESWNDRHRDLIFLNL